MNSGTQGTEHPHPGALYHAKGFPRIAYLPDTEAGRRVIKLLVTAFRRRLIFTLGLSLSLGRENFVTLAGIHHKTEITDIARAGHGYPDPDYLDRITQELRERGVTEVMNYEGITQAA